MKPATSPPGITNPHDIAALHRLSNGRYAACLTASGSGYSEVDGIRLTAWEGDPTEDRDGFFIYLRDNQNGRFWSVGRMPAGFGEARYSARSRRGASSSSTSGRGSTRGSRWPSRRPTRSRSGGSGW